MKRRIALFANGWGDECLYEVGSGVFEYTQKQDMDLFAFVNYSIPPVEGSLMSTENQGESNIFRLPELRDFDGAILLTNSFNTQEEIDYLSETVRAAGIPAVSILYDMEGIHFLDGDNYSGMHELMEHLVLECEAKELLFIGGSKGHAECQIRLQAFLDVTREHGIAIEDKNVQFGDWAANSAIQIVGEWLAQYDRLPDAIVCANDIMAIGLCEWLTEQGYRVPEDVKVTGFDCLSQGQKRWPTLTTVSRNWKEMGYQAASLLAEKDGNRPIHRRLSSSLVKGGTSGCFNQGDKLEFWEKFGSEETQNKRRDSLTEDQHFRRLYMYIRRNENLEDLNRSIQEYLRKDGWMEGDYFMLCLHPDFFVLDEDDSMLMKTGYPEYIDRACYLKEGKGLPVSRIAIREAIAGVAVESENPDIYLFTPVHAYGKHFGFAMMSRDFGIVEGNLLYIWTRHMNQYLEQVRSNAKISDLTQKLTDLSRMDILTKTYNRVGCEEVIYPAVEACQRRGGRSVLMIADVDHMKQINDKYGHPSGDMALRTVAKVLKEELPEGFSVARFGGDEFLLVGEWNDAYTLDGVIQRVENKLAEEVKRQKIEFELTVSIGGTILDAGEMFVLTDALQTADENMYREKAEHHEKTTV